LEEMKVEHLVIKNFISTYAHHYKTWKEFKKALPLKCRKFLKTLKSVKEYKSKLYNRRKYVKSKNNTQSRAPRVRIDKRSENTKQ